MRFFKSKKFKIFLCLLTALAVGILTAVLSHDGTSPVSDAVSTVLYPLRLISSYIVEKTDSFSAHFKSSGYYIEQIEELNSQLEEYRVQLVDYENTKQKIAYYEDFLNIQEDNPEYRFADAHILYRDGSDIYQSFTINKGSSSGMKVGMPVIVGSYLVGSIREVGLTTSTVYTVLHPELNISAYEVRSGEEGFVTGDTALSAEEKCKLIRLEDDTAVSVGGIVVTSGIGGRFPRDLIIGTVESVHNESADISAYAILKPGISISDILDVFVITSFS